MKLFLTLSALVAVIMAEESQDLLKQANNQFTAKMFGAVAKENVDKSFVLSAFSVLTPLAQLGLASVDESHDELLRTIGLPNDNVTKTVFSDLKTKLRSVKGIDLKTASKIYVAKDAELNPEFSSVTRDVFNSEVQNVDFVKNVDTAKEINTWVEDQTNHRIKDLVSSDSLDGSTRSVLVNAIYFKGKWSSPFAVENTKEEDFHVSKDKTVKVPMMSKKDDFRYAESADLDAKLLEMYYEGGEASMLVVLPNKVDGLPALVEKLKDPEALTKATENMYTYNVNVSLPKFKIETTTDLKKTLQSIGVEKVFSAGQAKLVKLLKNESNLFVSQATQKAFIEVNEEGAEAAAANAFIILESFSLTPSSTFLVDKPFYFELKHQELTLFSGVIVEPSV